MALTGQGLPEHFSLGQNLAQLAWGKMAGAPQKIQEANIGRIKMFLMMVGTPASVEQDLEDYIRQKTEAPGTLKGEEIIEQMRTSKKLYASWINNYVTETQTKAFDLGFYSTIATAICEIMASPSQHSNPMLMWALTNLINTAQDIGLATQNLEELYNMANSSPDGSEVSKIKFDLRNFMNECIISSLRAIDNQIKQ